MVRRDGRKRTTPAVVSRAEASTLGAELMLSMGGRPSSSTIVVADLLAGHLADAASEWSPTTHADAVRVARRLPEPFLSRQVRQVSPAVIAGLYRQLRAAGWSPHRLRRLRMVLNGAWKRAISYEWTTTNPCRDIGLPKADRPEVHPPDDATLRRVLDELDGAALTFVMLAITTGARRGELVALRWEDLDLDQGEVVIRRALVQVPGRPPVERPTKTGTKGSRVLPVDLPMSAMLRRHRTVQAEQALANGLPPAVWVFSHDAGSSPWRPDYITREFARARARAGVTGVRLHDVRHYVISTMLRDGFSLQDAAGQAGHASIATTASVYWRFLPGRNRDAAEQRARRLGASAARRDGAL